MGAAETSAAANTRWSVDPTAARAMDTEALRANFLIESLFEPGRLLLTYTHYDRMVVGGATPVGASGLRLDAVKSMGTKNFLDRRELLVVNIGGEGVVRADGQTYRLKARDMLYLGMGNSEVWFESAGGEAAKFYLLSAPAHHSYDNRLLSIDSAKKLELGAPETANRRTICQFIHPDADVKTCQLVAGITSFAPGSVWNTMPPHLHDRRMEVYLYFDLAANARVFHMMGEPHETRHLVVANEQAVISPAWSIHAGAGTASYAFVWAMAGDNVDYTDVDPAPVETLR